MVETAKALFGPEVSKTLRGRVVRACKEAVEGEDWFQAAKLTAALRDGEFDAEVCAKCDRFCYVTSYDYEVCPRTQGAIELMNSIGATPEEVDWEALEEEEES